MYQRIKPVAKTTNQVGADVLVTEKPDRYQNVEAYCHGCTAEHRTRSKEETISWAQNHAASCTFTGV